MNRSSRNDGKGSRGQRRKSSSQQSVNRANQLKFIGSASFRQPAQSAINKASNV
jgi:hypothetical protein